MKSPGSAEKHTLTPHGGANDASRTRIPASCPVCLKRFRPYRRSQRFCNARCRLLFWAMHELAAALRAGQVEGLRDELERIGRAT